MQVSRKQNWRQIFKNMRNKVCSVASTNNNLDNLSPSKGRLANFILYEIRNYSLEHFNWPFSMRTNFRVEKRSFYCEAD